MIHGTLRLLTCIIAIAPFKPLHAQQDSSAVRLWTLYPGYVITNSGDTVHGYLMLKNLINNQGKVFFFNDSTQEDYTVKYKPGDIKAYKVGPRFYETLKFPVTNTTRTRSFFLRAIDGPITLYKSYFDDKERVKIDEDDIWNSKIDLSFSESELKENLLGRKLGAEIVDFGSFSFLLKFKKTMAEYVSDYPDLAKKIANKEKGYEWADLEKVIREYNSWYLKNH
jgi:hypothetical protein